MMNRVEIAIKALQKGEMIVLTDDIDRENEGDVVFSAESTTPEKINFMIRNCGGLICLTLLEEQIKKMGITLLAPYAENTTLQNTPFAMPIDAKSGTTGVSASDRALTILTAIKENVEPHELVKPGHVFP